MQSDQCALLIASTS